MFQLIGMIGGVAVGWLFGVALASILRSLGVSGPSIEKTAFAVTVPVLLLCGAWGGLLGYRRDRRG